MTEMLSTIDIDPADFRDHPEWLTPFCPMIPPSSWRLVRTNTDGCAYGHPAGLYAIISGAIEADGKRWVHLSVSHVKRIPTWDEFKTAKDAFLGDVYAYQVLPPKKYFVNINHRVLHLFHCVDGPPLPEFTRGLGTL